jgi:hypothetical protein
MSETGQDMLRNLDEEERGFYMALVGFIMKQCEASGVILTILDGKHGSGSMLGVENETKLHELKNVFEESLKLITDKIINQSMN